VEHHSTYEPKKLDPNLVAASADGGRIADNIVHFARLLRASGLPVGPDRIVLATEAVIAAGIERPSVLHAALQASFVSRPEHHVIFDQAFYLFWRDQHFLEQMLSVMLPKSSTAEAPPPQINRRLADALLHDRKSAAANHERIEFDLTGTFSADEVLRAKDFEQMSADEVHRARAAIRDMALAMEAIPTRRWTTARTGPRLDLRRIMRDSVRIGPDHLVVRRRRRVHRRPPLVVICDISGSMDIYARMMLHFLHALANARERVHAFLFATRLTNITRALNGRDPDAAIARIAHDVTDWSGGTRIGRSLADFNRLWARRVLGQNATVLLVTDGLDREGGAGIAAAARRLRASCRKLVWLNPLVRYDGYSPLAQGAAALEPHVSELRPCHNLDSLAALVEALSGHTGRNGAREMKR
jgi:uncharacterized protein with von Willebrand factor type A (vWA) domain